jgi:hypothetical protein
MIGAGVVYEAIVAAHTAPEWAVIAEVGDATGGRASRRADALAMNLWPSRGLEIRGFEIKVSRSDLKRELDDPSKADAVGGFCHSWALATPTGLVRSTDNVPACWGLFEVDEKGSGIWKRQPTMRPVDEVKPPSRLFTAAIARAASAEMQTMRTSGAWIRRESVQAELDKEYQRGIDHAPDGHMHEIHRLTHKLEQVKPLLAHLGIDLDSEEMRWKSTAEQVQAMKIGMPLVERYGRTVQKEVLVKLENAIERLKTSADAVRALDIEPEHVEAP